MQCRTFVSPYTSCKLQLPGVEKFLLHSVFNDIWKHLAIFLVFLFFFTAIPGIVPADSFDLGIHNVGLSIGNSENWTGMRINKRDRGIVRVKGINITILSSQRYMKQSHIEVTGLSLGLIAPTAHVLRGIQAGGIVQGERVLSGISIGIGAAGGERVNGVTLAGGLVMGKRELNGISLGIGAVAGGRVNGLTLGGIFCQTGKLRGVSIGGLFTVTQDDMSGLTFGGISNIAIKGNEKEGYTGDHNVRGVILSGLFTSVGDDTFGGFDIFGGKPSGYTARMTGIVGAGLLAGAQEVRGILAGGFAVSGRDVRGVSLTLGCSMIPEGGSLTGLSIGTFNYIRGKHAGLTIGIVNYTSSLHGIQFGLINHVSDNPKYFRTLPIMNVHFK